VLLTPIDPAGQDHQQQLPGLKDKVHGFPDANLGRKAVASGLVGSLSRG
jgi:hypothetical protein